MRTTVSRPRGYLVVCVVCAGLVIMFTLIFGRSYAALGLQKEPFDRTSYVPSFDPIEDVTLGLSSNSGDTAVSIPSVAIRAIEIYPTQTIMVAGGQAVRVIDVAAPKTLHDLVADVADANWLVETGTVITVKAAVIAEHGSSLAVAAPGTTEVVMQVRQGVLLAAVQATLTLTGVDVHASDTDVPTALVAPDKVAGRPFIVAIASTMTISGSTFRYLGRDWNSSYGVSWSKGSTGSVRDSLFEHNFIGVYTNASNGLKVINNRLYYNSLYGVDPHSWSTHIDVEDNTSDYNGRHGIIFSNHVTDGIVRNNITSGNGLNGIMMDESSTGNTIDHNTIRNNKSDGIVLASSAPNFVVANTVHGNRVGITVRGGASGTTITQNKISNNRVAIQGTTGSGNDIFDNGGEWIADRVAVIWSSGLLLLLILLGVTRISQRGRPRRHAAPVPPQWVGGAA